MTRFEEGIWQAAFVRASEQGTDMVAVADGAVVAFRTCVAWGTAGLPVSEGNVQSKESLTATWDALAAKALETYEADK